MHPPLLFQRTAKVVGGGLSRLLDLVLPPHCALCRTGTEAGVHLCAACSKGVQMIDPPRCAICSLPFSGDVALPEGAAAFHCPDCREAPPAFECVAVSRLLRGPAREMLHRFKYLHQMHLRHVLASWLLDSLEDPRLRLPPPTGLVAVPLHPVRLHHRGFNQSEEIARLASRKIGVPLLFPLKRTRFTRSQTRLSRSARMENLRNAFALRQNADVRDQHLILIDDVLTTGSTLNECARQLRRAGAASVRAAAILRG